jgi:hypothetical protein
MGPPEEVLHTMRPRGGGLAFNFVLPNGIRSSHIDPINTWPLEQGIPHLGGE